MPDNKQLDGALQKASGLDVYDVDNDTVVLHLATREVHKLNPTAAFIWHALDEMSTAEALADALSEAADISQTQALQDVQAFIAALRKQGLLVDTK